MIVCKQLRIPIGVICFLVTAPAMGLDLEEMKVAFEAPGSWTGAEVRESRYMSTLTLGKRSCTLDLARHPGAPSAHALQRLMEGIYLGTNEISEVEERRLGGQTGVEATFGVYNRPDTGGLLRAIFLHDGSTGFSLSMDCRRKKDQGWGTLMDILKTLVIKPMKEDKPVV